MFRNRFIKCISGKIAVAFILSVPLSVMAEGALSSSDGSVAMGLKDGELILTPLTDNSMRVRYCRKSLRELPEWVYIENEGRPKAKVNTADSVTTVELPQLKARIDLRSGAISYFDNSGRNLLNDLDRSLTLSSVQNEPTYEAKARFDSPSDEVIIGLGQFQDGHLNVRGLSRRLTQVNTQISVPLIISSRGYGLLWNTYGMTEYNPSDKSVRLQKAGTSGDAVEVDVTSTEGGKKEIREDNLFRADIDIPESGYYALLLDVGQTMARHHNLAVDDSVLVNIDNLWLPPTTSMAMYLDKGRHTLTSRLDKNDSPTVFYRKIDDTTTFSSPVADCVDYTVFSGTPDDVVAAYRKSTGAAPLMPLWSLGYIHCRERFHSQDELLATAGTFREKSIPLDVIVQDWQYWGKNGWNAMEFDRDFYPNPKLMVDSLHALDMKMMLSVWSKVDLNSVLGKQFEEKGYFIPGTTWVDFFNPEASEFYWRNFSDRLLSLGIDSWWQDATEPENDDLRGRKVLNQTVPGEIYRNVYPLLVNKTVYEGCRADSPSRRAMILTRSAYPGIQRYGTVQWSGDVGNDWETLRIQLAAGLGFVASGMPWWTYDAGGFFRPGNQHSNPEYIECMLRWIQASAFLPMMRVHGYMSDTEPWRYGEEAQKIITGYINLRYCLIPYIYSEAAQVTFNGSTIMRPLMFDFPGDSKAIVQKNEYMFGKNLLVNPVTAPGVTSWTTYLPVTEGGWIDIWTGKRFEGGADVTTEVDINRIPVFVKAGAIMPVRTDRPQSTAKAPSEILLEVYPGADGEFELYFDDGTSYAYENGEYSFIPLRWDNSSMTLSLENAKGKSCRQKFRVKVGDKTASVDYNGEKTELKF